MLYLLITIVDIKVFEGGTLTNDSIDVLTSTQTPIKCDNRYTMGYTRISSERLMVRPGVSSWLDVMPTANSVHIKQIRRQC